MEESKKPKRPRIGNPGLGIPAESAEHETRYEKVNYPSSSASTDSNTDTEQHSHGGYQQRNYGAYQQRPYQQRPQGYQPRPYQQRTQGYQQRPYQPRPQGADQNEQGASSSYGQPRQQGYGQSRPGGYNQPRQQGGYNQNRPGGYNQPRQQGGYNQNRPGGYNQNRQQNRVRIFESGLRFVPDTQAPLGIRQDLMLAGVICGNRYEEHWNLAKETVDFYDLKGDLESVLDLTGKLNEVEFRAEANPALHPGQSAAIYLKGERIGFVGVVHPELERKLDLNGRTLVFELEWNKLADRVVPQAREISRFPANRRDIAVVVAENVPAADILSECKKVGVNQVVGVNLFDVYRGKGVAEGYKSLAISLILQDTSRTLEEEEIAATVAKCVEALKERFQASLRD